MYAHHGKRLLKTHSTENTQSPKTHMWSLSLPQPNQLQLFTHHTHRSRQHALHEFPWHAGLHLTISIFSHAAHTDQDRMRCVNSHGTPASISCSRREEERQWCSRLLMALHTISCSVGTVSQILYTSLMRVSFEGIVTPPKTYMQPL